MSTFQLRMSAVVGICLSQLLACGSYGSNDGSPAVREADGHAVETDDVDTVAADNGEHTQESDEDSTSGVSGASGSSAAADASEGASAAASTEVTSGSPPESSAGAVDDECPTEYDLPNYDGDVSGLCDPKQSAQCHCPTDVGAVAAPACSPDGTECIMFGGHCVDFSQCGWGGSPACPEMASALLGKVGAGTACVTDRDCAEGHYCNQRVTDRMFCDDVFVARAEELCPTFQLDGGVGDGGR